MLRLINRCKIINPMRLAPHLLYLFFVPIGGLLMCGTAGLGPGGGL